MKLFNILIGLVIVIGAYIYLSGSSVSDKTDQTLTINQIVPKSNVESSAIDKNNNTTSNDIPSDIKDASSKPESNDPNELPDDLKAQLNAPPPELPEDLKKQLAMPPQELPEDLKAQLNAPPPELPEDMKKALSAPPRIVTIDEVNTPPDLNQAPAEE
jgi:hypothetical protein